MIVKVNTDPVLIGEYGINPVIVDVAHFNSASAKDFANKVAAAHNTGQPFIPIMIDSYGGDVYALMKMIDVVTSSTLPIITIVSGKAMSCGAVLFTFGDERFIGPHGTLMLHDAANMGRGYEKALDSESNSKELNRINRNLWRMMEKNTGQKANFLWNKAHEKGRSDLYISPEQAMEWGLATKVGIPRWEVDINVSHKLIFPEVEEVVKRTPKKKGKAKKKPSRGID